VSYAWWPHTDDPRVASFRLRSLQIVDAMRSSGRQAWIYRPGAPVPRTLVLSKRYDTQTMTHAQELRGRQGTRLMLDLCDNHFHYTHDASGALRARADQLRQAIREVDVVVTASEALASVVSEECPGVPAPVVIPDAAEPPHRARWFTPILHPRASWDVLRLQAELQGSRVPIQRRLIWFGNHGSMGVEGGLTDLRRIRTALESACRQTPLWLTVVSNDAGKYREIMQGWAVPGSYVTWHMDTFSRIARLHSAVVIPITPNPFTRCKTSNRIATAILHGLNVIADRIPSYEEFADSVILDDWTTGLGSYLDDAALRARHLRQAQLLLDRRYTLMQVSGSWLQVLDNSTLAADLQQ
jgi:hypothetical protein